MPLRKEIIFENEYKKVDNGNFYYLLTLTLSKIMEKGEGRYCYRDRRRDALGLRRPAGAFPPLYINYKGTINKLTI